MNAYTFTELINLIQKYQYEKEKYNNYELRKSEYIQSCEKLLDRFVSINKDFIDAEMSRMKDEEAFHQMLRKKIQMK